MNWPFRRNKIHEHDWNYNCAPSPNAVTCGYSQFRVCKNCKIEEGLSNDDQLWYPVFIPSGVFKKKVIAYAPYYGDEYKPRSY